MTPMRANIVGPPDVATSRPPSRIATPRPHARLSEELRQRKTRNTRAQSPAAGNGIFGCRDEAPKIVIQTRERPQRPKSGKPSGRKSPQKRAIRRRAGNVRFAETGWWCAQSDTNRSPLDIRLRTGNFCKIQQITGFPGVWGGWALEIRQGSQASAG